MRCHGCGTYIQIEDKIFRGDTCPKCSRPLHCCKNCTFYDPKAYHECRETQAEWVRDKESANFCDYFKPSQQDWGQERKSSSETARESLEKLFKKKS